MASEVEFWRQDPTTKAENIAREVERLSRRARSAGLSVTAYIVGLAVEEARKEARTEIGRISEVLGLLGVLSVEDDYDLALVAVGGVAEFCSTC